VFLVFHVKHSTSHLKKVIPPSRTPFEPGVHRGETSGVPIGTPLRGIVAIIRRVPRWKNQGQPSFQHSLMCDALQNGTMMLRMGVHWRSIIPRLFLPGHGLLFAPYK
jgi:hypothetical protein